MSRPVLVLAAVSAGGVAATGVLSAATGVPSWITLALALVTAVSTAVGGVLVTERVAPWSTVAAQRRPDGSLLAGPAAPGLTEEGQVVDVLRPPLERY